jgi:predicted LPLAT superfamily acyltransferase
MHADRFLEGNKTAVAPFLGAPARFPAGPFSLATGFKVPVSFVFAMKESALHYHFFASAPRDYDYSDKAGVQQQLLYDFTQQMQQKVKQYPVQWYNYYDFWKN